MIGRLTETAQTAMHFALTFEQLNWPQDEERYAELRAEAQRLIGELELDDVVVPDDQDDLLADVGAVTTPVTAHLSAMRGRILGDTVALPLFFLESFALRYAIHAGVENPDAQLLEIIEDCIEDLGLDRALARDLERQAGWITLRDDDDAEPYVRQSDVIKVGSAFVLGVMEEFGRSDPSLEALAQAVAALQAEVADFRAEFRESSLRLEQLVIAGNAEVTAALGEVKAVLVQEAGVAADEAATLTEGDPQGFWERAVRWFGGAPARDAAEAALWAALDFVPAGTGVKLGIKVAAAIRKALKQ
jgi:hypothetical protein